MIEETTEALESKEEFRRDDLPSLLDRIKAIVLDSLIIITIMFAFTTAFDAADYEGEELRMYAYLSLILYDPLMVSLGGTFGHRLMKIKIRRFSNESKKVLFPISILRFIAKALLGWLSLITVGSNKSKRAIHDLVSNSIALKKS